MWYVFTMSKEDIIKNVLQVLEIPTLSKTGKSIPNLILLGYRKAGWSAGGASKFTKKHCANKPSQVKLLTYVLGLVDMKYCAKCDRILELEEFSNNSVKLDAKATYCKSCMKNIQDNYYPTYYADNRHKYAETRIKYRLARKQATPKWADLDKIKQIYSNCPEGYHVDHYYPLQGDTVCGLHVPENLQYLLATENISKSNKMPTKPRIDPLEGKV